MARVMKICRRYLFHMQNSVFEGTIRRAQLKKSVNRFPANTKSFLTRLVAPGDLKGLETAKTSPENPSILPCSFGPELKMAQIKAYEGFESQQTNCH